MKGVAIVAMCKGGLEHYKEHPALIGNVKDALLCAGGIVPGHDHIACGQSKVLRLSSLVRLVRQSPRPVTLSRLHQLYGRATTVQLQLQQRCQTGANIERT